MKTDAAGPSAATPVKPATPLTATAGEVAPTARAPITPLVARKRLKASLRVGTTAFDSVQIAGDLPARIEGLGFEALRAEGIMTAVNAEYVVEIVVAPLGDESAGYVSTLVVYHGDEEVPGSRRRRKCELCLEDELLHQLKGELDLLAPMIKDHAEPPVEPESPPEPPVEPEVVAPPPVVELPPPVEPEVERRRLGRLGRAGIGAVILGAVSLGAGSALLVADERSGRDLKAPSIALLGVGGVAVLTGVGLLVVDKETRKPHATVAPTVSRSGGGLLVVGRF
ncbi:MAG: hypothetical protein KC420_06220 [Myxococcales bacterium]|nr:hypothetical protein [Myxococcales bacterium]MCB9566617.1 hypothetical protein [Myxococcales bacterium]MCB9704349.1 hypothetical protein [Myxococcales bacterium]